MTAHAVRAVISCLASGWALARTFWVAMRMKVRKGETSDSARSAAAPVEGIAKRNPVDICSNSRVVDFYLIFRTQITHGIAMRSNRKFNMADQFCIPSAIKKYYFLPRTKEDVFLLRNVHLGASGLAFLALIQFVGHKAGGVLELFTFAALANASLGFAIGALLLEQIYLWCESIPEILLPEYYWTNHLGWLDIIVPSWAGVGGVCVFFGFSQFGSGWYLWNSEVASMWLVATITCVFWIGYIIMSFAFRRKLIRTIEESCSAGTTKNGGDPAPENVN